MQKERKPHYQFLPKREKDAIARVTPDVMLEALANGESATFNNIVGVLQNLKDVCGEKALNEDHKRILEISVRLYKIAEGRAK